MPPGAMEPQIPAGRTRETKIRRDAHGRWFNDQDPIDHPNLVRAFNAWIDIAPDGRFCLKNDINWAYVHVEGAPLFVHAVRIGGDEAVLTLSDGREEPLDPSTLRQSEDGTLYCSARERTMTARFDRTAMQQLEPLLGEDEDGVYLALGGSRHRPPVVDDPLVPGNP